MAVVPLYATVGYPAAIGWLIPRGVKVFFVKKGLSAKVAEWACCDQVRVTPETVTGQGICGQDRGGLSAGCRCVPWRPIGKVGSGLRPSRQPPYLVGPDYAHR